MQIKYVNRALQRFDATQVIPVQFVMFTLSVILGSAILYRDFERTSGEDAGKFVGGCALTFLGVWFITTGRPRRVDDEEDEDREPEPEDAINLMAERYRDSISGASGGAGGDTRRSSTLRAVSPPRNILSRYLDDDASRPTTPNIKVTPDTSARPHDDRPATTDMTSSMLANPWSSDSHLDLTNPPLIQRHTSTPVLPSEAAPPPLASRSNPDIAPPRTPTRGKSHDQIPTTPDTSHSHLRRLRTGERIGTLGRNSIPGPLLASPLSTTLSAMVQDLKRGGSIRNKDADGAGRRRESVLGIGSSEMDDTIGEPLSRRRTHNDDESSSRPSMRGRSFSGTLNELWKSVRGTSSREDIGGEEGGGER
jgi:hypothetical protein